MFKSMRMSYGLLGVAILFLCLFGLFIVIPNVLGVGGFGPEEKYEVLVTRLYVDVSGGGEDTAVESSYMVGTDKGVFEVDNGYLLNVWNADEIYSKLEVGKRYKITTKGKRYTNAFLQEYPYIVRVEEIR